MDEGYIKLYRQLLDSVVFAHPIGLKIWVWCLLKANYQKRHVSLKIGKGFTTVTVNEGQFIFGRFKAEEEIGIDGSTIYKWIKKLQDLDMIKLESNNQYTIITICKWDTYQQEKRTKVTAKEQPSNNRVTTVEQQSNTNNKEEEYKESKEIIEYLNFKANKKFKYTSDKTQKLISARLNDGFNIDEFKKVIDNKVIDWLNDEKFNEYLRPETLFGTKFESYLNKSIEPKLEKSKTIIINDGIKRFDCIYDSDPKHYQHSEEEIKQHCAKYNTNLRAKV